MGTLLYEQGIDQCFEEVNLSQPEMIYQAHQNYVLAGAELLQTNTYAANRLKLQKYGLEWKMKPINEAAVKLAKQAAGQNIHVVGTVGGIRRFQMEEWSLQEVESAFF